MRRKSVRNVFIPLVIAFISLAQAQTAHAARHALLIGNDSYQEVPTLRNARADAQAMSVALQKAGYAVTVMQDRNLKEMKDDVRQFKANIKGGDEVIFFYSGHGVQIEAMNYLLPVDVRADSEDQVRDDALALSRVLEDLRAQKPALTVAVIDACRDNPFKGTGRAIGGRGLTGVGGANGQMVIYSAGEGQQALDRLSDGDPVQNGLFTRVFIREMTQPGVPIDQVARKVRSEVNRMAQTVNHEQVPAIYDQVIGQFYFYAQNDSGVDEVEILFWQSVEDSNDPAELQAYLDKYPDGQFSALAQARIKRIELSKAPPATVPAVETATSAVAAPTPPAVEETKALPVEAGVTATVESPQPTSASIAAPAAVVPEAPPPAPIAAPAAIVPETPVSVAAPAAVMTEAAPPAPIAAAPAAVVTKAAPAAKQEVSAPVVESVMSTGNYVPAPVEPAVVYPAATEEAAAARAAGARSEPQAAPSQ